MDLRCVAIQSAAEPPSGVPRINGEQSRTSPVKVADSPLVNMDRGPRQLWAAADVSSADLGVYTVIGALMGVGVVLILIAAWLFKATKP